MNHTLKRLFAAAVTTAVSLSLYTPMLTLPVQAEETSGLTITNPGAYETYEAYQILILDSASADDQWGAYQRFSYIVNPDWLNFFENMDPDKSYAGYFAIDPYSSTDPDRNVRMTTPTGANDLKYETKILQDFLKDAQAYIEDSYGAIAPKATLQADGDGSPLYTSLEKGYYLMISSMGTQLSAVNLVEDQETIIEKNEVPDLQKSVYENSQGMYASSNDAQIGDEITFMTTVTGKTGLTKYVVHDMMDDALEFNRIVSVTPYEAADPFTAGAQLVEGVDYNVRTDIPHAGSANTPLESDCDFELELTPSFIQTFDSFDTIEIVYTATLTEQAEINKDIKNKSTLQFSDVGYTEISQTVTKTWGLEIHKIDGKTGLIIAGAIFALKTADGQYVMIKEIPDDGVDARSYLAYGLSDQRDEAYYMSSTDPEDNTGAGTFIEVNGLDSGDYFLEEVAAPAGYNRLSEDFHAYVTEPDNNNPISFTYTAVMVENFTGMEMPGTGGSGTTLIYAAGTAFIALSGGLFVLKRRKEANE